MTGHNNKKQYLPAIAVISIVIAVLGWMFYRVEKVENRTENYIAQSVEKYNEILKKYGEIDKGQALILQRVEWIEKAQNEYKKANNGKLNLEDFFQQLFAKKK